MTPEELLAEAVRLALESVERGWGGPFGAVIARDGEILARGQNRVLKTGDPTAHAEIEAIRAAVAALAGAPVAPPEGAVAAPATLLADPTTGRARMLAGYELFASSEPCPMCLAACRWARLDAVWFSADRAVAAAAGFDDVLLAADGSAGHLPCQRIHPELAAPAFAAWAARPDLPRY